MQWPNAFAARNARARACVGVTRLIIAPRARKNGRDDGREFDWPDMGARYIARADFITRLMHFWPIFIYLGHAGYVWAPAALKRRALNEGLV